MIDDDTLSHGSYEYAGFKYEIHEDEDNVLYAIPHDFQHHAAFRMRNMRNAVEQFNDEYRWDKRKRKELLTH